MQQSAATNGSTAARDARELSHRQAQIATARKRLAELRHALSDAEEQRAGDHAAWLLKTNERLVIAALTASKVLAAIGAPFTVDGVRLVLTARIGISLYPDDGEEASALIHLADAAMYRAKKHGRGGFAFHGDALASGQPGP